jgi:hypothetical protein
LHEIFRDDYYAEWAANLVTHYRHFHIKYYDRSWRSSAYASKNPEYREHEDFKIKVNNRAKRQLIRALRRTRWPERFKVIKGFLKLMHNDKKTIKLIMRR